MCFKCDCDLLIMLITDSNGNFVLLYMEGYLHVRFAVKTGCIQRSLSTNTMLMQMGKDYAFPRKVSHKIDSTSFYLCVCTVSAL